jgi:hypothetical protein
VSVGSFNAILAKALLIAHRSVSHKISLESWLEGLYHLYFFSAPVPVYKDVPVMYQTIYRHLQILLLVMTEPPLFYDYGTAHDRVRDTLKSLIETLFVAKEYYAGGCVVSELCLQKVIESVVTKGGCTEKGLEALDSVEVLLDKEYISDMILIPIVSSASQFPTIVVASLQSPSPEPVLTH